MSTKLYEDALWLPWISGDVLHKPGDAFCHTTKCGIYIGHDERTRMTDLYEDDGRGFSACRRCFQEGQ